jgi:hypothetical protein
MKGGRLLAGLALLAGMLGGLSACVLPPDAPTIVASANGTGPDDAYVVYSRMQENEVLALLGLTAELRTVRTINGHPYDVVTARSRATGEAREVWFDISCFDGR